MLTDVVSWLMASRLAEFLYWMACWIAIVVAMLALAAFLGGGGVAWVAVISYFATAIVIWLLGHAVRLMARKK